MPAKGTRLGVDGKLGTMVEQSYTNDGNVTEKLNAHRNCIVNNF